MDPTLQALFTDGLIIGAYICLFVGVPLIGLAFWRGRLKESKGAENTGPLGEYVATGYSAAQVTHAARAALAPIEGEIVFCTNDPVGLFRCDSEGHWQPVNE